VSDTFELKLKFILQRSNFSLDVDLTLPGAGITVIFGPSGCGKTTLLRCVAGLERPMGVLRVSNSVWQDSSAGLFKPTWQRSLGYVFQEASLFEHLSVAQNLEFGLSRVKGLAGKKALEAAIELLGIGHLLSRAPQGLSGGERQRIAIARALATEPQLLLLDEPMASLDIARKKEIIPWLERLHHELKIPALYVTHSLDELARLADHVVILEQGRVKASGGVAQTLSDARIAQMVGDEAGIMTEGMVVDRQLTDHLARIRFDQGEVWVRDDGQPIGQQVRIRILARDVSLSLAEDEQSTIQNRIQGVIQTISDDRHPAQCLVSVRCGETILLARVTRRALNRLGLAVGQAIWCQIKSVALVE
jgi:molybdate transport system ATP-binding protein